MAVNELQDPFALVATALGCEPETLSMESAMYRDHGWDSFGHISIITALEEAYGISIEPSEIETYMSMAAIKQLHARLAQESEPSGSER
jgi:acyl carrier protein